MNNLAWNYESCSEWAHKEATLLLLEIKTGDRCLGCILFESEINIKELNEARAKIAILEAVVNAAKLVDTQCPEGFDDQDSWTNEAHRKLHAFLFGN